jgi:hypothetical protein
MPRDGFFGIHENMAKVRMNIIVWAALSCFVVNLHIHEVTPWPTHLHFTIYPFYSCSEEANEDSPLCYNLHDDSDNVVSSIYINHDENEELVAIKNAFTPQEAFVVQSLAKCIQSILPLDLPYYQKRAFYSEDTADDEKTEDDYLKSGHIVTFMAGSLQVFAPGVAARITQLALMAWEEAGWNKQRFGRMPDPRTTGIRTSEHLYYQNASRLNLHTDSGSNYTVLLALTDPDDYDGGEFRLLNKYAKFKPDKLTALVFRSAINHGVESITSGIRETFATELWSFHDAPQGKICRPDYAWTYSDSEESERKWKQRYYELQRSNEEEENEELQDAEEAKKSNHAQEAEGKLSIKMEL